MTKLAKGFISALRISRRAVAWGAVVALTLALFVARAEAQSLFFSEPFNGPGVGPNLEDPDNAYVVSSGVIRKNSSLDSSDRRYVRTVREDYHSNDWTYTISFDTQGAGQEIVFIGVGAGVRNPAFFNEPGDAAFFRIHSKSLVSGRIDVAVMQTGLSSFDTLLVQIGSLPADGVFTARIEKTGNDLAFSIDGVTGVHVIPVPAFLNDTNTRLFFGNAGNVVKYDNMVVAFPLTPINTSFNNPIGIDHHEPTNQVVMSVNYPSGTPRNFELVAADGTRTPFSTISGLTDEVKIATVRSGSCQGGFTPGELFTGTGVAGQIARISPDGLTTQISWVTLPGETGLMRGSLFQDKFCSFGGDLIVVTTAGKVWRVTSSGSPTLLASLGTHLEGVTTVPNDTAKYGPWAGKILAGAEGQGRIYTIDASGNTAFYELGINPEDFDIIPANENFFGVDFGGQTLWGAPASAFTSMVGDILIAQEFPGILWHVRWNGSSFEATEIARVTQWEHVTFSSAGIVEIPPTNQPPDCSSAAASPSVIWPPNHKMVPINITGVTDPDGDSVTITASAVTQDEAVNTTGVGAGNTAPDATLSPLAVRAERNGNPKSPGNGRVYHIDFTADDGNGGQCTGAVTVCVPHDQRPGAACVDGGPLYNSLAP